MRTDEAILDKNLYISDIQGLFINFVSKVTESFGTFIKTDECCYFSNLTFDGRDSHTSSSDSCPFVVKSVSLVYA